VVFHNTQDEWKNLVTDVAPDHDVADRTQAFDLALRGGFSLGVVYRERRPTLNERYAELLGAAKTSDVDAMIDAFTAREGVAMGGPAGS
jgi:hypothetical protein